MLSSAQLAQAVQGRKRGLGFDCLLTVECWLSLDWNKRSAG